MRCVCLIVYVYMLRSHAWSISQRVYGLIITSCPQYSLFNPNFNHTIWSHFWTRHVSWAVVAYAKLWRTWSVDYFSCKSTVFTIQWNPYKATTKFRGLPRQVVFHDRENKHDFVKTMSDKWLNLCVFSKTSPSHYTGSIVLGLWALTILVKWISDFLWGHNKLTFVFGFCVLKHWDEGPDSILRCLTSI